MSGVGIFLIILLWIVFWLLAEAARDTCCAKKTDPYYKNYIDTMKYVCKDCTIFGKIIIGVLITIIMGPGLIIIPIMHFLADVFKAAMFK